MDKCWRCGGGKTISMTTTGTHQLPCPTCNGSGEFQHPELEPLTTEKSPATDLSRIGSKVA